MTLGNYHFTTLIRGISLAAENRNSRCLLTFQEDDNIGVVIDLQNGLGGGGGGGDDPGGGDSFLTNVYLKGGIPAQSMGQVIIYDYARQPTTIPMGIFSVFANDTTAYTRSRNNASGALYGTSTARLANDNFQEDYIKIFNAFQYQSVSPFEPQSFFSIGTYIAPADNLLFTAAVETLFETVTGQTLP